jgi:ComF family protein
VDISGLAWRAGRLALDALLPPRCLGCGGMVADPGALCPACWERIDFLAAPLCERCGTPFELDPGAGATCGGCLREPPRFRRARAVLRYDDHGKQLILRFKHADRIDMAPTLARWMARAGAELLADADVIAPVPLHWSRLFARRYNQAALLANGLSALSGVPAAPRLLERRRRTISQGSMGRAQRLKNVKRAFAVRDPARAAGRAVLLVDDVLTTGATAGECARVLLAAGAAHVDVLTVARVVRPV